MSIEQVRVGALHIPLLKASSWVASYVDAEKSRTSTHPFAYPAYDHFVSGSGENELNDGDLLAPALLNVRPSISTFLGLQAIRGYLEEGLVHTAPSVTLASAIEQGDLHQRMDAFVGILDGDRPRGIKLTTLTKILHRKRPGFMPLHDKFVAACYVGESRDHPLQRVRSRNWVGYWTAMSTAIQDDLEQQPDHWEQLADASGQCLSPLRLLDVVAWNAGKAPSEYQNRAQRILAGVMHAATSKVTLSSAAPARLPILHARLAQHRPHLASRSRRRLGRS